MSGYDVGLEEEEGLVLGFRVFAENAKIDINPKIGNRITNAVSISILVI